MVHDPVLIYEYVHIAHSANTKNKAKACRGLSSKGMLRSQRTNKKGASSHISDSAFLVANNNTHFCHCARIKYLPCSRPSYPPSTILSTALTCDFFFIISHHFASSICYFRCSPCTTIKHPIHNRYQLSRLAQWQCHVCNVNGPGFPP